MLDVEKSLLFQGVEIVCGQDGSCQISECRNREEKRKTTRRHDAGTDVVLDGKSRVRNSTPFWERVLLFADIFDKCDYRLTGKKRIQLEGIEHDG